MLEAIISIAIAGVVLLAFAELNIQSARISRVNMSEIRATLYLRELIEVTKDLEQSDWNGLNMSCTAIAVCHPEISSNKWTLMSNVQPLESGVYTRWIYLESVDSITKKATAVITWHNGLTQRKMELQTYLYNLQ